MSTATEPEKIDWLVVLPDHEGALARRMEVRQYVPCFRKQQFLSTRFLSTEPYERLKTVIELTKLTRSHLSAIKSATESGFWKMGGTDPISSLVLLDTQVLHIGAMLEEVPKEGEGLKIMGSAMMAYAATKEEVLEAIKQDVYFKTNVWNLNKVCVHM